MSAGGTITTGNYFANETPVTDNKVNVIVSGTKTGTIALTAKANAGAGVDARGVFHLASGSIVDLKAHATTGALLQVGADDNSSILVIDEGVTLGSSKSSTETNGGVIAVEGEADTPHQRSELRIAGSVLDSFFATTAVSLDGKAAKADVAGGIALKNAKLVINTDKTVELGEGVDGAYVLASGTADATAAGGKITLDTAATIAADKVSVSKAINAEASAVLAINAKTLTLGSDATASNTIKFSGALVSEGLKLVRKSDEDAFNLATTVTFAGSGSLVDNDVILGTTDNGLTVQSGVWTADKNITVSGGKLDVATLPTDNGGADASVTLSKLTFGKAAGGVVEVEGNTGTDAILDLTQATVTFNTEGAALTNTISVSGDADAANGDTKGYGILKVDGDKLLTNGLLKADVKDGLIIAKGGKVEASTASGLTFKATALKSGADATTATSGAISFHESGWLDVAGAVTINAATSEKLNIGTGILSAKTMTLNSEGTTFEVSSGSLLVSEGLTSNKEIDLKSAKSEVVFEGQGGDISAKVKTSAAAKIDVVSGTWVAKDTITLASSGSLLVGSDGYADLTLEKKLTASGENDSVSVANGSKLTLNEASFAAKSKLTVTDGDVVINGNANASGDAAGTQVAGVSLKGDVTVNGGSTLTLGEAVVNKAITYDDATKSVTVDAALKSNLTTAAGAEVVLGGTIKDKAGNAVTLTSDNVNSILSGLATTPTQLTGVVNVGANDLAIKWADDAKTEVTWTDFEKFAGVNSNSQVTSNLLKQATVTGITTASAGVNKVKGHVGALKAVDGSTDPIIANGTLGLYSAKAVGPNGEKFFAYAKGADGKNKVLGITSEGGDLILANGGTVGAVTVQSGDFIVNGGETKIEGNVVASGDFVAETGTVVTVSGTTTLGTAGGLVSKAGSTFNLNGDVALSGGGAVMGTLNAAKGVTVANNETLDVYGNVIAKSLTLGGSGAALIIGHDALDKDDASTEGFDESKSYTGSVFTESLDLAGGVVVVDPEYGEQAASLTFKNVGADNTLNGGLVIAQNSFAGVGFDSTDKAREAISFLTDANGSLDANKYGAALVINNGLTIKTNPGSLGAGDTNDTIVLYKGTVSDFITYYNNAAGTNIANTGTDEDKAKAIQTALGDTIYLGENSAVVATEAAAQAAQIPAGGAATKALITFSGAAGNTAANVIADGGDVVLSGNVEVGNNYQVFGGTASTDYKISYVDGSNYTADKADKDIELRTTNGLLAGKVGANGAAALEISKDSRAILGGSSDPMYQTYISYLNRKDKTQTNNVLATLANTSNGADGDRIVRAGAFTGVAHATVAAGSTTAGAVGARFGLGSTVDVTAAANNHGGAMFVAPIYANTDSDGFSAQGISYGVDVDLYGAAIGSDFEVAEGFRVGALINLGSGDTEGNGAAAGSTDDFNYYGFGVYAGYSVGALTIVGDINYTHVSNKLEIGFDVLDKANLSLDSSNLNLGVGAQYALDFNGLAVVPHAGIRYMRVEADDYAIDGVGSYAGDDVAVVAIPVGVTVAKAFSADTWTIKPTFDVTLTSNLGDDELEGAFKWANVADLQTKVATEIVDGFTYGATAGIAAQTGNFAAGLGVNYTGSSNTDSFAVSASARFLF